MFMESSENYPAVEEFNDIGGYQDEEAQLISTDEPAVQSNPMLRKIIRWLVYAAAFLIPLWFLPFTADVLEFNKQVLLIAVAGIGLILYLVDVIKSGVFRYKMSVFYLPIVGLVAAGAVSTIFSVNRITSLFGAGESRSFAFITLASLAILFFLAINVIEDKGKMLKKLLTASLSLAFLFGVLQIFSLAFLKSTFFSGSFSSVGSLNALGILAALTLALFTYFGFKKKYDEEVADSEAGWPIWAVSGLRYMRYLGLVLAIFIIVLINWWPVWSIAFVSLLGSVAFTSAGDASLVKNGKMRLFLMPMAIIVLGIFLMLINFNLVSLKSKLPTEIAPSHQTSWKIALSSLMSRPLGYGAENFVIAYDKFKPAGIANTIFYQIRFSDSASEAANMAVEGGVLAILSFITLLWFYGKELKTRVMGGVGGNVETGAIWAASIGLFVAFFLYPFNLVVMTLLFLLLALIVLSTDGSEKEQSINLESDAKYSFAGSLIFIVGLVMVLVAGYFTFNNYIANAYLARALTSSDNNKAIGYFVQSANSNPNDARTYRLLSQTILNQLAADLKAGPKNDESRESYNARIQNQIASAINIGIRATNIDPANSQNWVNRGLIYQNLLTLVGGADQAAVNSYNESLARNPADPDTYFRIGNMYLTLADGLQRALAVPGNQDVNVVAVRQTINASLLKAEENYKKAIALNNDFGQALYNLAVVYDNENKLPDAIKQFEKLIAANPRDPSIAFQLGLLYYRNNQKDNAFTAWQQAVLLFPNYSNARWYLSLVYEERGDLANALAQVKEIEKLNPDNNLVKQRLAQLESGKRMIPPDKVLNQKPLNQ